MNICGLLYQEGVLKPPPPVLRADFTQVTCCDLRHRTGVAVLTLERVANSWGHRHASQLLCAFQGGSCPLSHSTGWPKPLSSVGSTMRTCHAFTKRSQHRQLSQRLSACFLVAHNNLIGGELLLLLDHLRAAWNVPGAAFSREQIDRKPLSPASKRHLNLPGTRTALTCAS